MAGGLALTAIGTTTDHAPASKPVVRPAPGHVSLARLPLSFEANRGQTDRRVAFLSRGSGHTLFLTGKGSVLTLDRGRNRAPAVVRTTLTGASVVRPRPEGRLAGIVNVLKGPKRNWHKAIPTYARVRYPSVYPGIDAVYHGSQGALEYDLQVAAGVDPGLIRLGVDGARRLSIAPNGDLLIAVAGGTLREHKPIAYQTIRGTRVAVEARFRLNGRQVAFVLGRYDRTSPLVIDPVLSYSSYLGGSAEDQPEAIKVSPNDNTIFVVGYTKSNDFPGATARTNTRTDYDAFITHLDATGTTIEYTTYLGGSGSADDRAHDVTVDVYGDPIVVGETSATDFAAATSLDSCTDGGKSAWQAQISTAAHTGVPYYKTCFGGAGNDIAYGVASRLTGSNLSTTNPRRVQVFITGTSTSATNFPQVNGYPNVNSGGDEVFLVRSRHVCSSGTCDYIDYGTLLTEAGQDEARDVALDGSGNAYVTGDSSSDFLAGSAARPGGAGQAFVVKINPNNTGSAAIIYFTWFTAPDGSPGVDVNRATSAYGIGVSSAGVAYIAGQEYLGGLPGTENLELYHAGATQQAFVGVLGTNGAPTKSIYVGSNGPASFKDISLTESGGVVSFYAVGDFTGAVTASGAINGLSGQSCADSDKQVGLLKEADTPKGGNNTTVIYFTCLGGSNAQGDAGKSVSHGPEGAAWITGTSASFPLVGNPLQGSFGGGTDDGFLARVSPRTPVIDTPAGKVFGTHDPTFTYHAEDAGMTFACSDQNVDQLADTQSGPSCTGNGTTTYTGLAEGAHTFKAATVDAGGTAGPVASADFTVDVTPPGAFDLTSPDDGGSTGTQPTFSWVQPTDVSDVSYDLVIDGQKVQDVPSSACTAGACTVQAAAPITGGTHKWKVVAHDAAEPTNTTTSTSERSILVQDPPTASFFVSPNPIAVGRTATLNGTASKGASNPITNYKWDLDGDGTFETDTGTTPTTTHLYDQVGTFKVGLRVTDAVGQSNDTTRDLKVSDTQGEGEQLGVSINKGAQYTNKPKVTLTIIAPTGTTGFLVSNDGGFAGAIPQPVTKQMDWTLDSSGPERLPKTVYVRFLTGPFASPNYTDDIILDERPPVVDSASIAGAPAAANAATAAKTKTYKVKVKAHDTNSGVGFVQVTANKKKPGKLIAYKKSVKAKSPTRPKFLRARDRAGNYSKWRKLR